MAVLEYCGNVLQRSLEVICHGSDTVLNRFGSKANSSAEMSVTRSSCNSIDSSETARGTLDSAMGVLPRTISSFSTTAGTGRD